MQKQFFLEYFSAVRSQFINDRCIIELLRKNMIASKQRNDGNQKSKYKTAVSAHKVENLNYQNDGFTFVPPLEVQSTQKGVEKVYRLPGGNKLIGTNPLPIA